MPCLELSMPTTTPAVKEQLSARLTEAFASATGHDASIFGIRFFEYEPGQAAYGGKLCVSWKGTKPYLHAVLYTPRLKRSVKQKLAEALTTAFTTGIGQPAWKPTIHICEHPYDNIIVDGQLLTDAFEPLKSRAFYFELPND